MATHEVTNQPPPFAGASRSRSSVKVVVLPAP
jgi:hypothetical protein